MRVKGGGGIGHPASAFLSAIPLVPISNPLRDLIVQCVKISFVTQ